MTEPNIYTCPACLFTVDLGNDELAGDEEVVATRISHVCPVGMSINDFCATLPKQRHSYQAKGLLLLVPRTKMVMVPHHIVKGGWNCVVVKGNDTYPVGGYDLYVSDIEIETAIAHTLPDVLPKVATAKEVV